ncbi:MAG: DUF4304 domain-containing protein [Nanoarchaeota archaeon]
MGKEVDRLIGYSEDLIRAFKSNKKEKTLILLNELWNENKESLSIAKEFKIKYLLNLHNYIEMTIISVKQNINNSTICIEKLRNLLIRLHAIVDQREVRDHIISEVIYPILKSWGYKKKARAFVKKEGKNVKRVNVYSSRVNDYYCVSFIFEISVTGPNIDLGGERAEEKWFELTEDTNVDRVKAEVKEHLIKVVKPFLDKIK